MQMNTILMLECCCLHCYRYITHSIHIKISNGSWLEFLLIIDSFLCGHFYLDEGIHLS